MYVHFLLGLSVACDKALSGSERLLVDSTGEPLGRDKSKLSSRFSSDETVTTQVTRTSCDVLGSHGDQKNGCRIDLKTFCKNSQIPSLVTTLTYDRALQLCPTNSPSSLEVSRTVCFWPRAQQQGTGDFKEYCSLQH